MKIPSRDSTAGAHRQRPGRDASARNPIADIQRVRILAAMVDVVAERGFAQSSVAQVVGRSSTSRRTFYEIFEDRHDCFLAALDHAISRAEEYLLTAFEDASDSGWRERIRAGLVALLSFADHAPALARLAIVESYGAGPRAHERRSRALQHLVRAVDAGRHEPGAQADIPALTAEGVVGAISSIVHARLVQPDTGPLIELAGPLMAMVVLPYLGPRAAASEMARPLTRAVNRMPEVSKDPMRDLPMRLTHRTVLVLIALATQPGASNREVGRAAGIVDQGQISKLLARLARIGLIANTGVGRERGGPNSWVLTDRGREVQAVIAAADEHR